MKFSMFFGYILISNSKVYMSINDCTVSIWVEYHLNTFSNIHFQTSSKFYTLENALPEYFNIQPAQKQRAYLCITT